MTKTIQSEICLLEQLNTVTNTNEVCQQYDEDTTSALLVGDNDDDNDENDDNDEQQTNKQCAKDSEIDSDAFSRYISNNLSYHQPQVAMPPSLLIIQPANFQSIHEKNTTFVAGIPMYLYPEYYQFGTMTRKAMTTGGRGGQKRQSKDKRKKCTCIKECKKDDCPGAKPGPQAKRKKSNCCSNK